MEPLPTNNDDVIYISDIIDSIDSMEDDFKAHIETVDKAKRDVAIAEQALDRAEYELEEWKSQHGEAYKELVHLAERLETPGDCLHDGALIRDSCFTMYAQELALGEGELIKYSWPFKYIDWEQAVDDLKQDFIALNFCGVTYWYNPSMKEDALYGSQVLHKRTSSWK